MEPPKFSAGSNYSESAKDVKAKLRRNSTQSCGTGWTGTTHGRNRLDMLRDRLTVVQLRKEMHEHENDEVTVFHGRLPLNLQFLCVTIDRFTLWAW
jgi:hypothetical protein